MATPVRTWTWDTNNTVSVSNIPLGYQAAALGIKNAFLNGGTGATNILSSNGTTAGAGDNWSTAADVALGAAGSGAWWSAQLGIDCGGGDMYVLLAVDEATPSLANRGSTFLVRLSSTAWTGGSTSALPTNAGDVGEIPSSTHAASLFPSSSTNGTSDLNWSCAYSNFGDVLFFSKQNGLMNVSMGLQVFVYNDTTGGGGGLGTHRVVLRRVGGGPTNSAWLSTGFTSVSANRIYDPVGATWTTGTVFAPNISLIPSSAGLDIFGNVPTSLGIYAVTGQRYLGQHPDFYFCRNLTELTLDASEAGQILRRVNLGEVMVFFPSADLPLP